MRGTTVTPPIEVPLRIASSEIRGDGVQVDLRLRNSDTRRQPGKHANRMRVAWQFLQIQRERHPDVELVSRLKVGRLAHEFEVLRQHPDNDVGGIVQRDGLSDNAWQPPQLILPGAVAQDRHVITQADPRSSENRGRA
jgi:hypothetical protein